VAVLHLFKALRGDHGESGAVKKNHTEKKGPRMVNERVPLLICNKGVIVTEKLLKDSEKKIRFHSKDVSKKSRSVGLDLRLL